MPIFILGTTNDPERLWIADTDAGTVSAVDTDGTSADAGEIGIATIQKLRQNGYSVIRDIDVAVRVDESTQPTSRQFTD